MSIANDASASSVNDLSGRGAFIHAKKGILSCLHDGIPLVYTRLGHRSEKKNEGRGCSKKRIREQKTASAAAAASRNIREYIVTDAGREAPTMDAEEKNLPDEISPQDELKKKYPQLFDQDYLGFRWNIYSQIKL